MRALVAEAALVLACSNRKAREWIGVGGKQKAKENP